MAPAQSKLARSSPALTLSTLLETLSTSAKDKPAQTLALPLLIALWYLRKRIVKAGEEAKKSELALERSEVSSSDEWADETRSAPNRGKRLHLATLDSSARTRSA